MRLVRVALPSGPAWADLADDDVLWGLHGDWEAGFHRDGRSWARGDARLLAPVSPSKIIGVARNYPAHAAEMGGDVPAEPKIFLKPPTSVIGPGEAIEIPPRTSRVDHEGELGVVIGKVARRLSEEDALSAVFGYTVVNDVTARDFQKADGVFARAKGFDTFCPVGPAVVTGLDPGALRIHVLVNGAVRQSGATADMHFPVARLIAWISSIMTLLPGDLIATGTPHGVDRLVPGDLVDVEIPGIGRLSNPVLARSDRAPA